MWEPGGFHNGGVVAVSWWGGFMVGGGVVQGAHSNSGGAASVSPRKTAVERSGFHNSKLYVSDSLLKSLATCSTLVAVKYALNLIAQEEIPVLKSGVVGHEALADYFISGSKASAMHVFREGYEMWAAVYVEDPASRLAYPQVKRVLSRWFDEHPINKLPFNVNPNLVEKGFNVPITDDIVLIGRMDLIPTDEHTGGFLVVDNKFTKNAAYYWQKQFRSASQLSAYWYAAEKLLDETIVGAAINVIELPEVAKDPDARCRDHKVPRGQCYPFHSNFRIISYDRPRYQIESWRKTAIILARKFHNILKIVDTADDLEMVPMEGSFTGHCRYCPLEEFCLKGRNPDTADSYLASAEEWTPDELEMMD